MLNYILAGLLIAIQIFDLYSTMKILGAGGQELNWLMKWLMSKLGVLPSLAITKIGVVALVVLGLVCFGGDIKLTVGLAVVNIFYIILMVGNFKALKTL